MASFGFAVASAVFSTLVSSALAQTQTVDAPLGLSWGLSTERLGSLGVKYVKNAPIKDFGASFLASNLPRAVSDQETTVHRSAMTISFGASSLSVARFRTTNWSSRTVSVQ